MYKKCITQYQDIYTKLSYYNEQLLLDYVPINMVISALLVAFLLIKENIEKEGFEKKVSN